MGLQQAGTQTVLLSVPSSSGQGSALDRGFPTAEPPVMPQGAAAGCWGERRWIGAVSELFKLTNVVMTLLPGFPMSSIRVACFYF